MTPGPPPVTEADGEPAGEPGTSPGAPAATPVSEPKPPDGEAPGAPAGSLDPQPPGRAGMKDFDTLLVWKSDVEAVGAGALAGLRKPRGPVMLYWVTEGQPDTRGFEEWLGDQAVTLEDPTKDDLKRESDFCAL